MKMLFQLFGSLLFFCSIPILATEINGRFFVQTMDSSNFSVTLQINSNTGTDDLGGTTLVFYFDNTAISIAENPVNGEDYTFHSFYNGNYSQATITRPMANQIWVNIDLPFINNNNGTVVAASPAWTDVVTIHFDVVDPNSIASLTWLTASPFWGIYDADNSTLWQTGQFENLFDPLPVELISFSGTLLADKNILLEWKTASSLNNAGFEVQKSYLNSANWLAIGFVESYGDPNGVVEYSFTDYTSHKYPAIKYRLKSIDHDGSFQYSHVIEINTSPTSFELLQNYPNPFNPSTKIKYSIPFNESEQSIPVQLKVYDILGNEVVTLVDEEKEQGVYEVEFNTSNRESEIASGIYIYRIVAGDFVESKKMILMK